ncbi:MAG: citrate/2-methylcitrate synthase, partial [Patescibacteria group bacterium]
QVSGAVNTMVTARAGRDLTAGLATGLLTIGPRFGGAINQASKNWLSAVSGNENPQDFVEKFASRKEYIAGIGHKKYRIDNPDPRVAKLLSEFKPGKYTQFALEVEKITSAKKSQLILNVDGLIAAMLLDMLADEEGYSTEKISQLIDTEFCNAIFVYARTVGFIAHYLDQKRLDEGLFRLPDDQISSLN